MTDFKFKNDRRIGTLDLHREMFPLDYREMIPLEPRPRGPRTTMLRMDDPDFPDKFRKAIDDVGGSDMSELIVTSSPTHREPGMPLAQPASEPFDRIDDLSYEELCSLGCQPWSDPDSKGRVLLLFPGEWYDRIPAGRRIVVITGRVEDFVPGKTDNDIRFGCLAYGVHSVPTKRRA